VPRRYTADFRRKVLDLIESGKPVAEVAAQRGPQRRRSTTGVTRTRSTGGYGLECPLHCQLLQPDAPTQLPRMPYPRRV